MIDLPGQAIYDYYFKLPYRKLWIHNTYGLKEEMPVSHYFRSPETMPELELLALQNCKSKVLDIGAGAGSHALLLRERKIDVTALEISAKAAVVIKERGVKKIIVDDVFLFNSKPFDTMLLLMNGIGLTGTIQRLKIFLEHAKNLIKPSGQLLFDSSDVAYLYEKIPEDIAYYGEIKYQYQYKRQKSEWFNWLYIDKNTMAAVAGEHGWKMEVLGEDDCDQYLGRLTLR